MIRAIAVAMAVVLGTAPAWAAAATRCPAASLALWGDGEHDDTAALNAWFRGDNVVWARNGHPVGAQIGAGDGGSSGDHVFRLTGPVYIPSGTGRSIAQFAFVWPRRNERVSGGTIIAGRDRDKPPVAVGLRKIGTRPGEGVPFAAPDPKPDNRNDAAGCLVSQAHGAAIAPA